MIHAQELRKATTFAYVALGLISCFYMFLPEGGDAEAGLVPHFALMRHHIWNEFAIPYFTPAKCACVRVTI